MGDKFNLKEYRKQLDTLLILIKEEEENARLESLIRLYFYTLEQGLKYNLVRIRTEKKE